MNLTSFLEHWGLAENPFQAEEARHDPVFARLGVGRTTHPDFPKVLGDPSRPSTSIVFGEKGSGKTAIRLQMASRVAEHNAANKSARLLLIAYDDLNPMLDRIYERESARSRARLRTRRKSSETEREGVLKVLQRIRLADHMDAILHAGVSALMDRLLAEPSAPSASAPAANGTPGPEQDDLKSLKQTLKRLDHQTKVDLTLLQVLYDRDVGREARRTVMLRRRLRGAFNWHPLLWRTLALLGWLPLAAIVAGSFFVDPQQVPARLWLWATVAAGAFWLILLFKHIVFDRWRMSRLARRIVKQVRAVPRGQDALAASLNMVPPAIRSPGDLPLDDSEETRYALFARLRRALTALGYSGMLVIVDRIDEPTLVSGDPDRMKAVIWPMLNNKFLQQHGLGMKLLLPIELKHELFRESQAFFQEARLDKQNMVEKLSWTGSTLFDLCNARLRACLAPGVAAITLADLFDPAVTRQDLIDALDQMHQPRDAFKFLYQCLAEHCSGVTDDQPRWTVSRDVLEMVRKQQVERAQGVYRGVRPA